MAKESKRIFLVIGLAVLALFLAAKSGYCRERAAGDCMQGGHVIVTQGLNSDTKAEQSYPSCSVAVYDEGTVNLSTIYADNSGTVKGNPFTSDANGYWFFYANNGRYDVHFYDSDITNPFTRGDYLLCDPADATGSFSCTGGGASSCPAGASYTQYVDSSAGSDLNAGTNWCSAKATETAAVTALGANGGWVYNAPNYTGAAATGVPANVHILRTNQLDAFRSTSERFSFPDWTDVTEDHHAFASNSDATLADAHSAYLAIGPFSLLALTSSVLGNTTVPAGAAQANSEQAGVAGIITNKSSLDLAQSDGVLGLCYNDGSLGLDCSGVVGVAGNAAGAGSDGSFEAMWANLSLAGTTSDAMGLVIRATGGHMPTAEIGTFSGRPNSAIDVAYGGASGDSFPSGIYFQNSSVNFWPIVFAGNFTTLNPHTDVYTYNKWHDYYSSSTAYDDLSAVKINNGALTSQGTYQAGNYIFENSANSSEVVLPINHSGTVSVDGVNSVAYSATPVFDRAQGKVQTITLTGNVSSSTLQNCVAGQTIIFDIIEDGSGGHTFVAPANLHGFGSIDTTISYHNRQMFFCTGAATYSTGYSVSAMQSGT